MDIIGISGKAGSGKDTSAKMIKKYLEEACGDRVIIIHFADILKYIAAQYYDWDGQKDEKGRTLLQKLGTDIGKKYNPGVWGRVTCELLTAMRGTFDVAIIPDLRFTDEVDTLKKFFSGGLGGGSVTLLRINRLQLDNSGQMCYYNIGLTEEQLNHHSEIDLDGARFDRVITTVEGFEITSLEMLEKSIKCIVEEYINNGHVLY